MNHDSTKVCLSRGFWMGQFEVTQVEWKRVMGDLPGELTAELPARVATDRFHESVAVDAGPMMAGRVGPRFA